MSVMSSLRRQVFGVPPSKGRKGRVWMKAERDSRTKIHERGAQIRAKEAAKKQAQQERREANATTT